MRLPAHALEDFVRGSPKTYHQRMRLQTREIGVIRGQAAAGRDHGPVSTGQLRHDPTFPFTENGFAVLLENVIDAGACSGLDYGIGVQKGEMEMVRDQPPDRRL